MPSFSFVVSLCLAISLSSQMARAATVVDSRNAPFFAPSSAAWGVADVGWTYTPSSSYLLSGLLTEFATDGSGISQTVTEELYSGDPVDGGALLGSASFTATEGTFVGT